jgi:hypothetical protein
LWGGAWRKSRRVGDDGSHHAIKVEVHPAYGRVAQLAEQLTLNQ